MSSDTEEVVFTSIKDTFVWYFFSYFVFIVGSLTIINYLWDNLNSPILILKAILEPYFLPQQPQTLIEKFGKWAVVTGATDGIGREYAKELAKQGINVVLISRTAEKLVNVATEIENEFKVKTKWIAADFSQGRPIYEHIEKELSGIPVGILVNNVGKMYDFPEELDHISEDTLWDMININVAAVTIMSRMIIPQMKKRGKGAIVNISSGSELHPVPLMAVYASSKRYIRYFTQAIDRELAEYNVTVQCVTPLFVQTKMNHYSRIIMDGGILIPDVKSFARSTVFTLGKTKLTTGYWSHALQFLVLKLSPEWIRTNISYYMMKKLRDDYLKQEAKET